MQLHIIGAFILHALCFISAIIVSGLYGKELRAEHVSHSKLMYAVVVCGLSAVTSLVYSIPKVLKNLFLPAASWSLMLFILWIAVFGLFGATYIKMSDDEVMLHDTGGVRRMKVAVWIDLVNALLWLVSAVSLFAYWLFRGDRRTRFTGRAYV